MGMRASFRIGVGISPKCVRLARVPRLGSTILPLFVAKRQLSPLERYAQGFAYPFRIAGTWPGRSRRQKSAKEVSQVPMVNGPASGSRDLKRKRRRELAAGGPPRHRKTVMFNGNPYPDVGGPSPTWKPPCQRALRLVSTGTGPVGALHQQLNTFRMNSSCTS